MSNEEAIMSLSQQLEKHIDHCDHRFEKGDEQFQQLTSCLTDNTKAIKSLATNTKEVVDFYRDVQSFTTVGVKVQKFGLWLLKWPLIGAGLYTVYNWIVNTANTPPH